MIKWELKNGVGVLTLNRPDKYNALNQELVESIGDRVDECKEDKELRTLIITATGKAFCAGGDVGGHPTFNTDDLVEREHHIRMAQRITIGLNSLTIPTIAAIQGLAFGAGLDLALGCDLRLASENARFSSGFVAAGVMPDMGCTYLLPRLVGMGRAKEMILTGKFVDASEALAMGLVNRVIPQDQLMDRTMELAGELAAGPLQAYRYTKWALGQAQHCDLETALSHEMFGQNVLLGTEDVKEAVRAFAEKRKPVFKGK